jgi:hypothetical protein
MAKILECAKVDQLSGCQHKYTLGDFSRPKRSPQKNIFDRGSQVCRIVSNNYLWLQ